MRKISLLLLAVLLSVLMTQSAYAFSWDYNYSRFWDNAPQNNQNSAFHWDSSPWTSLKFFNHDYKFDFKNSFWSNRFHHDRDRDDNRHFFFHKWRHHCNVVPEPFSSTLFLLGSGVLGLSILRKKK